MPSLLFWVIFSFTVGNFEVVFAFGTTFRGFGARFPFVAAVWVCAVGHATSSVIAFALLIIAFFDGVSLRLSAMSAIFTATASGFVLTLSIYSS